MTYRERRERKAERLREWASKRETVASATLASHEVYRGDHAFNFQPGHIPQRARVIAQADRAFESLDKAQDMNRRADSIEAAAERAIYDDDPDAVERLQERIADAEAMRDRIKAFNQTARKGTPDFSILTEREKQDLLSVLKFAPYQSKNGAFPSYKLSNLNGCLTKWRERLARLSA